MGVHESAYTHSFVVSRLRSGKWRAKCLSISCSKLSRLSWADARNDMAQAIVRAAFSHSVEAGAALVRKKDGVPLFALTAAMHRPDGTPISFEEQGFAERGGLNITHHQVTVFRAELLPAAEHIYIDETEEGRFAEMAALIEPFPVPGMNVVYVSADEFAADLRDVIACGLRLASQGASTVAMQRFSGWFGELLAMSDLNRQQKGAARWIADTLFGRPADQRGWQEKLTGQLAHRAAQVCCRTPKAGSARTGPSTSPRFMRMIAADVAIRDKKSVSAVARDHEISRQKVRDALDCVRAKNNSVLAEKIEAERHRRKIEQREQRMAIKVAQGKLLKPDTNSVINSAR